MNRYLLEISYIGTHFNGVTRIAPYYNFCDRSTILGEIEYALKEKLKPVNQPMLSRTLSRTDARVHATKNSIVIELERKNGEPYRTEDVTAKLNNSFYFRNINIRVNNTHLLPSSFSPHSVEKRTYLYRLAVSKKKYDISDKSAAWTPIEEAERCLFLKNYDFQINRMLDVAPMFVGKHDFRSFMRKSKEERTKTATFSTRTIDSLTVEPGKPCVFPVHKARCESEYDYWNLSFTATSYIYRQIRNIVATLIDVGKGELTRKEVYEMLTIPSHSWKYYTVPACGLYLGDVRLRDGALSETQENSVDSTNAIPELKQIP